MIALADSNYVLGDSTVSAGLDQFVLWIDQVGAFLVLSGDEITIGGPPAEGSPARIAMLANLSRRHATVARGGERYLLKAHAPAFVGGRPVHESADLADGCEIALGESVRLRFRQPNVMSGTARIDFLSDHRPARPVDGIVLMHDTCLLGPGPENHIRCPQWDQPLLLFRRDNEVCCKARDDLFIDGRHAPRGGRLANGSVVSGADMRFRAEAIG